MKVLVGLQLRLRYLFLVLGFCLANGFALALAASADSTPVSQLPMQVFSPENKRNLCKTDIMGKKYVSSEALALILTVKAGVPDDVISRNAGRPADRLPTSGERLQYLRQPQLAGATEEDGRLHRDLRGYLRIWLGRHHTDYTVVPAESAEDKLGEFLAGKLRIECTFDPPATVASGKDKPADALSKPITDLVHIRQKPDDYANPQATLKNVNPAKIGYSDDQLKKKNSFNFEGTVGVVVSGTETDAVELVRSRRDARITSADPVAEYNITPYVYYKNLSQSPKPKPGTTQDIDFIQPGILGSYMWASASGNFAYNLQGQASSTLDWQANSRADLIGLRFSPSFVLFGDNIIFVDPIRVGFLQVFPRYAAIAREHVIEKRGSNTALAANSYFSIGSEITASVFLNTNSFLDDFSWRVGFLDLQNTDKVPDVNNFTAGVSYTLPKTENVTINIDYVDGRDQYTLQKQKTLTASTGIKF